MKKLFLLLIFLILFSCTSEETSTDEIVGSWYFYALTEVTIAGEEYEVLGNECNQQSTKTFDPSGDYKHLVYWITTNADRECAMFDATATTKMMWEEVAEGQYRIFTKGANGTLYKITFPDKNTLWMIPPYPSFERDGVQYEYIAYVHKRL